MPVQFTCPQCFQTTFLPPSRARRTTFCSRNCLNQSRKRPAIHPIGPSLSFIPLSDGSLARVFSPHAEYLSKFLWSNNQGYAVTTVDLGDGKRAKLSMHGAVFGLGAPTIDHADNCRLHNEFWNLRSATVSQNCSNTPKRPRNTSGFKGVFRHSKNRWSSSIRVMYKTHYLGIFDSPEKAYAAYCEAAQRLHGEFARLD